LFSPFDFTAWRAGKAVSCVLDVASIVPYAVCMLRVRIQFDKSKGLPKKLSPVARRTKTISLTSA